MRETRNHRSKTSLEKNYVLVPDGLIMAKSILKMEMKPTKENPRKLRLIKAYEPSRYMQAKKREIPKIKLVSKSEAESETKLAVKKTPTEPKVRIINVPSRKL